MEKIKVVQIVFDPSGVHPLYCLDDRGRVWYSPSLGQWMALPLPDEPDDSATPPQSNKGVTGVK